MTKAKVVTHWALLAVSILFVFSGFGITEFRTVEALTSGVFSKALAFMTHDVLWIPFLILLIMHVTFSLVLRRRKKSDAASIAPTAD